MTTVNQFNDADPLHGILRGTIATAAYLNALGLPPTILTPLRTITASGVVQSDTDYILLVDATAGDIVLQLPTVTLMALRREFWFKRVDATDHTVSLVPSGSETIDGQAGALLSTQNETLRLINTGLELSTLGVTPQASAYSR
ncbi:MAG TPA: hypothetical protein DCG53_12900, partial [Syntrophus sp. (in: bacteria)]|nr:hypothetical protein [Syntrophus sp. (in: bacteria)]